MSTPIDYFVKYRLVEPGSGYEVMWTTYVTPEGKLRLRADISNEDGEHLATLDNDLDDVLKREES